MRVAASILLTDEERTALVKWAQGRSTEARLVLRAKIVLAAADGATNKQIAADLGTDTHTAARWRNRFAEKRLPGIKQDAPRGGRPPAQRQALVAEIIRRTTQETPPNATHWSTRTLARALGTDAMTVQRVWKAKAIVGLIAPSVLIDQFLLGPTSSESC